MELVMVTAITSILMLAVAPSFSEYSTKQRLRAATDALHQDLAGARSQSISAGLNAVVCPLDTASACAGELHWENGWMVFLDRNTDRQFQTDEELLRVTPATDQLVITSSSGRSSVRFKPGGTAPGSNLSITICHPRFPQLTRQILVSNSGRIRRQEAPRADDSGC
jgi:type IV fimbrial biogenesis protein FimT